jgi:hypothetical protein
MRPQLISQLVLFYSGIGVEVANVFVAILLKVQPPLATHKIAERYGAFTLIILCVIIGFTWARLTQFQRRGYHQRHTRLQPRDLRLLRQRRGHLRPGFPRHPDPVSAVLVPLWRVRQERPYGPRPRHHLANDTFPLVLWDTTARFSHGGAYSQIL